MPYNTTILEQFGVDESTTIGPNARGDAYPSGKRRSASTPDLHRIAGHLSDADARHVRDAIAEIDRLRRGAK